MSWFRCPEARPFASLRLVCFPHAGGSAGFYRPWAAGLSPAVELHAVQYPGRADRIRDPFITDLGQLSRLIAGALAPLLDRPVAFFGHSMGAVVAYETARVLQGRGRAPAHLFASGTRAPHDRDETGQVGHAGDDELVAEMVKLGGTDGEILQDPEMRELVLPYVRNDFRLIEAYRHKPGTVLSVPVTAITGDADPHVTPAQAARWSEMTEGAFAHTTLPGDHFYLAARQDAVLHEVHTTLHIPT